VSQKVIATDCYTKYPFSTASCHDLITDGTMATGRSFRFPETVHAGAETGDGDLRRWFHRTKAGDDHLVVNFRAVIAAVFGYFRCEM
jgi:hypothetical protein